MSNMEKQDKEEFISLKVARKKNIKKVKKMFENIPDCQTKKINQKHTQKNESKNTLELVKPTKRYQLRNFKEKKVNILEKFNNDIIVKTNQENVQNTKKNENTVEDAKSKKKNRRRDFKEKQKKLQTTEDDLKIKKQLENTKKASLKNAKNEKKLIYKSYLSLQEAESGIESSSLIKV